MGAVEPMIQKCSIRYNFESNVSTCKSTSALIEKWLKVVYIGTHERL